MDGIKVNGYALWVRASGRRGRVWIERIDHAAGTAAVRFDWDEGRRSREHVARLADLVTPTGWAVDGEVAS